MFFLQILPKSGESLRITALKDETLQLDLRKKQSLFFEKSLTWGHRKSTRNIMFENKKIKYFLKFVTF